MSTVRIKAKIIDEFTRTTQQHIQHSDLPTTYSADEDYIYKVVDSSEYLQMLESPDGIHMSELGIAATLDENYNQ